MHDFSFCRYGPPTRTEYRLTVENLSSRVSWQVSNICTLAFTCIFLLPSFDSFFREFDCYSRYRKKSHADYRYVRVISLAWRMGPHFVSPSRTKLTTRYLVRLYIYIFLFDFSFVIFKFVFYTDPNFSIFPSNKKKDVHFDQVSLWHSRFQILCPDCTKNKLFRTNANWAKERAKRDEKAYGRDEREHTEIIEIGA